MVGRPPRRMVAEDESLVAEWAHDLNDLAPDEIGTGSGRKVWWRCPEGHEYQARPSERTRAGRGRGCPYCSGNRPHPDRNLAVAAPEVAAEWAHDLNGELRAEDVTPGADRKVWWRCPHGHEWQTTVNNRVGRGSGCPFCTGRAATPEHNLEVDAPHLVAQWDSERNDIDPGQVVVGSQRIVWWRCPEGPDHEWRAMVRARVRGGGCPFCLGRKISVTNSLATLEPALAAQLDVEANGGLTADQMLAGTHRKVWWRCPKGPDHAWEAPPHARRAQPSCPFCIGQRVSVTNSLATVAPAELLEQWHPERNGDLTPADLVAHTHRHVWWRCPEGPDHEWQAPPHNRLIQPGCPFCIGQRVSVTNSLASLAPDLAAEWHERNPGDPDGLVAGSGRKVWWRCRNDPTHEWQARTVERYRSGHGCPNCRIYNRSRLEIRVAHELAGVLDIDIEDHTIRVDGRAFDVDFVDRQRWLAIEYDGAYWHKDKTRQDAAKAEALTSGGWTVIRLREQPLDPLSAHDVSIAQGATTKEITDAALRRIIALHPDLTEPAEEYLARSKPAHQRAADNYIAHALGPGQTIPDDL